MAFSFKNIKANALSQLQADPMSSFSGIVPADMQIIGDVVIEDGVVLVVDGKVHGSIKQPVPVPGTRALTSVTLSKNASVTGSIEAEFVTVIGARLNCNITAKQIILTKNARVKGNLNYETLAIELGCKVDGLVNFRHPEQEVDQPSQEAQET